METMHLTFSGSIEASDQERRIISGKILPFGEVGNTSAGKVVFEKDSLQVPSDKKVKLLLEHDPKAPLGIAKNVYFSQDGSAAYADFKVAKTTRGNDALVEAEELREGLSVGVLVEAAEPREGILYVQKAILQEVSLVHTPAFNAGVTNVAASESEPEQTKTETTNQESEAVVENLDTPTVEVETEKVEASRPTVTAPAYTAPRSPINSHATYLEHSIRAAINPNSDSALWVRAADDTTTNNAGLIPTFQSRDVINGLSNDDRGVINAISRGTLPPAGMSFEIPKISAVPTMDVVAEEGAITETGMTSSFITVNVKAFKGGQEFSIELLDRSSPEFFAELSRQMQFALYKAQSDYVLERLVAVGGAYGPAANSATGLVAYVAGASSEAYTNSLGFARSLVVSPTQWGNIMGYNVSGAPLYNATNPMNQGGNVGPTSTSGQVMGLNLFVDRNIGVTAGTSADSDLSMIVLNPDAYTWYEGGQTTLRTDVLATGQVKVALVAYGALAEKLPLAGVWNDIAV